MLCLIVGIPRSGTGWAYELLTAHPDAVGLTRQDAYPDEPKKWGDGSVETGMLVDDSYFTDDQIRELVESKGPGVVVEKTPRHCAWVERAWSIYPDARVIAIERDHYAIMESHWHHFGETGAGDVDTVIIAFQEHLDKLRGNPAVLFVRYEDLVEDLEVQVQRMCDHVGLAREGVATILSKPRDSYMSEQRKAAAA